MVDLRFRFIRIYFSYIYFCLMYTLIFFFNKFVCNQTKASGPCSTAVDHLLWTSGLAYVLVHVDVSMASDWIETMEQMKQKSAGFTTAD